MAHISVPVIGSFVIIVSLLAFRSEDDMAKYSAINNRIASDPFFVTAAPTVKTVVIFVKFFHVIGFLALCFEVSITMRARIITEPHVDGLYVTHHCVRVGKTTLTNGANQFAIFLISHCQFTKPFTPLISIQSGKKFCNKQCRWVICKFAFKFNLGLQACKLFFQVLM